MAIETAPCPSVALKIRPKYLEDLLKQQRHNRMLKHKTAILVKMAPGSILLLVFITFGPVIFAQTGIGTDNPDNSAALELRSTTKGLLPPRMTQDQRNAIVSPELGMVIFNTTTNCLNIYLGNLWNQVCGVTLNASIQTLNCSGASNHGSLKVGMAAKAASSVVSYTGSNGGTISNQPVPSTGVRGLTAVLSASSLPSGNGNIKYDIVGMPIDTGTASFDLQIGGQTCTLKRRISSNSALCNPYRATEIIDVYNPKTGKIWMDRNLGAHQRALSSTDPRSYGSLFQWGRAADGHQCVHRYTGDGVTNSSIHNTSKATSSDPNGGQSWDGKFIVHSGDWLNPSDNSLWQGTNGINNPCPKGYRVPTSAELNAERLSWSSNDAAGAMASPLKWSLMGWRRQGWGGRFSGVGHGGNYWSSTVSGPDAHYLFFNSTASGIRTFNRAEGHAVRCVKD